MKKDALAVFDDVENSSVMGKLWTSYQKKFSYAADISWKKIMKSVRSLFVKANIIVV